MKNNKIPRNVGYVLFAVSFIFMLITAGASDAEMLSFNETLCRVTAEIAVMIISVVIVEYDKKDDDSELL